MTPSTPKPLVLNSSDKLKQPKLAIRTMTETTGALKNGFYQSQQQQQPPNQSIRGTAGQTKNSSPKAASSHVGKFQLLKPIREKKHPLSQVQSRNDFFNLMRKKSLLNTSPATKNNNVDNCGGEMVIIKEEGLNTPASHVVMDNGSNTTMEAENNSAATTPEEEHWDIGHKKNMCVKGGSDVYPDEEEAAFLRSLGF